MEVTSDPKVLIADVWCSKCFFRHDNWIQKNAGIWGNTGKRGASSPIQNKSLEIFDKFEIMKKYKQTANVGGGGRGGQGRQLGNFSPPTMA